MRVLLPLTLGLVLAAPAAAQDAEATPRAIVENPKLDLGRVVRGEVAEGTFRVRNLGAATLHIKQAKPG
ncbi:MAG TPA: hypothetical protein VFV75_10340 [Candidatus Polarisedimenticolaceae bacterium]|nr:hypothetical protein [Candidatus Polarisedimenticolaceae bacterium]